MSETKKSEKKANEQLQIREYLVNTAVSFLLNPEVINKTDNNKVAFLKKKGLTDAEISEAFKRAQNSAQCKNDAKNDNWHNTEVISQSNPPPIRYVHPKPSFLTQLSSISSSLVVLGVALYGLHRFYVLYIEPWLFGTKSRKSKLNEMEQQFLEMNRSFSQLKTTVSALEETISQQKIQIDRFFQNEVNEYLPTPLALKDLKTEVASVKSLLLNRHQFPAVPKVSPSIPVWQLPENEATKTAEETVKTADSGAQSDSTDSFENIVVNGSSSNECDKNNVKVEIEKQVTQPITPS